MSNIIESPTPEIQEALDTLKALGEPDPLLGAAWRAAGAISVAMAAFEVLTHAGDDAAYREAEMLCRENLRKAYDELGAIKIPSR